jgi:hypothetical protein
LKLDRQHLTKSLLESRVVPYGGEVVVFARMLAERREQFDGVGCKNLIG